MNQDQSSTPTEEPSTPAESSAMEEARQRIETLRQEVKRLVDALLAADVELPSLVPADHPLLPLASDRRELDTTLLQYLCDEYFNHEARVALLERLDLRRAQNEPLLSAEQTTTLDLVRHLLLESDEAHEVRFFWMNLSFVMFNRDVQRYHDFWHVQPPTAAATEALAQWQAGTVTAQTLIAQGRDAVRAIAEVLSREFNDIADDYAALEARGVGELVRLLELLGKLGGPAAAFLLTDYLIAANHPQIERVAQHQLAELAHHARAAIHTALLFDDLDFASRYVLYEQLAKFNDPKLPRMLAHELIDRRSELEAEDQVDVATLLLAHPMPCQVELLGHLESSQDLAAEAREIVVHGLAALPQDRVGQVRARVGEQLPVLLASTDDLDRWGRTLAERFACELHDSRIQGELVGVPALFQGGYSYLQLHPRPGSKEQFLDRIAQAEINEQMSHVGNSLPSGISAADLHAYLMHRWWLTPRSETGRRPPLVSIYKEREQQLPAEIREEWMRGTYYEHLRIALDQLELDKGDLELVETHIDIAARFLPENDRWLRYAQAKSAARRRPRIIV